MTMPAYRTTSLVSPRRCPSTGAVCDAHVCNEGAWPCDPAYAARIRASAPAPAPNGIVETEDGVILSADIEEQAPAFAIEPEEDGATFEIEP